MATHVGTSTVGRVKKLFCADYGEYNRMFVRRGVWTAAGRYKAGELMLVRMIMDILTLTSVGRSKGRSSEVDILNFLIRNLFKGAQFCYNILRCCEKLMLVFRTAHSIDLYIALNESKGRLWQVGIRKNNLGNQEF